MNNAKKSLVPHRRFKEFQNAGAWEQRKLGDTVNSIVAGGDIDKSKIQENGKYPVYANALTNDGVIGYYNDQYRVKAPAVTVTGRGEIGVAKTRNTNFTPVVRLLAINSMHNNYFLENLINTHRAFAESTGVPQLTAPQLANYKLKFPKSIEEESKIGNFFNNLDSLITLHQRKLNKLKKLKSAYLTEMFPDEGEHKPKRRFAGFTDDWEQRKLGDVVERFDNLRIPVTSSKRKRGITPYYGANGIQDYVQGYTHDGEFVLVAEDGANDLQNYPIHYVNGKVWVNNHAHVLQGKKDIADNLFLVNAIKRIKFETYLVGGSRAKLNADVMMKLPIKMPKLNEQQKLGKYFSRIDTLIALHQRKIDKLQKLKNAYLNEMFV